MLGEGSAIGKLKVLEKSLKRSFANVRLDILNIKEYLENQHDIINSELADLQGQLFSVKRDLKENKRAIGEDYVRKDALDKRLRSHIKSLKDLRDELEGFDSRIGKISKNISNLERESVSTSEFDRKSRVISKDVSSMRSELDEEFDLVGEELRDIRKDLKKELISEQAKVFDEKVRRLDKSLKEVDELKEDLRQILESAKKREKVKKEIVKLEEKVSKKPFYKSVWAGVVDFFEEEPEEVEVKKVEKKAEKRVEKELPKLKEPNVLENAWQGLVDFFTEEVEEKPKRKPRGKPRKRERDYAPIVFIALIAIIVLAVAYYFYSPYLVGAFSKILAMKNVSKVEVVGPAENVSEGGAVEAGQNISEGVVVTVHENDFVNIVPNASDPDKDKLTYTFTYPLNKSGQWQTQVGDAGIYPIVVTVSDSETETKMEFTLFVKPLNVS